MWIKIIFAIVIIASLGFPIDKNDWNRERSMHMATICIAGILALAAVVIFS